MNNLDDELLIALVRGYEELYDSHHKNYANHDKKEACWRQIGKEMGTTGKNKTLRKMMYFAQMVN